MFPILSISSARHKNVLARASLPGSMTGVGLSSGTGAAASGVAPGGTAAGFGPAMLPAPAGAEAWAATPPLPGADGDSGRGGKLLRFRGRRVRRACLRARGPGLRGGRTALAHEWRAGWPRIGGHLRVCRDASAWSGHLGRSRIAARDGSGRCRGLSPFLGCPRGRRCRRCEGSRPGFLRPGWPSGGNGWCGRDGRLRDRGLGLIGPGRRHRRCGLRFGCDAISGDVFSRAVFWNRLARGDRVAVAPPGHGPLSHASLGARHNTRRHGHFTRLARSPTVRRIARSPPATAPATQGHRRPPDSNPARPFRPVGSNTTASASST
jgi:hypothetical protein